MVPADRAGAQPAREGVGVDFDADAVGVGQPLGGEYVLGEAVRDDAALVQQHDAVGEGRRLVQVVQDGYVIGDRVLRPAMVGVSKGGPKADVQSGAPETTA